MGRSCAGHAPAGTGAGGFLLSVVGFAMGLYLMAGILAVVLLLFGAVFAVNSSVHRYLIFADSDADKVALNVDFYYMASAVGRLGGTLAPGVIYQFDGLQATLWASAAMLAVSFLVALALPKAAPQASASAP